MNNNIFREKSLKRVSSPDVLTDYLHVPTPAFWLVAAGILLLIVGALVWQFFGSGSNTVTAAAQVIGGKAQCYVAEEDFQKGGFAIGTKVTLGEQYEAVITEVNGRAVLLEDDSLLHLLKQEDSLWAYTLTLDTGAPDGTYSVAIKTNLSSPIEILLH